MTNCYCKNECFNYKLCKALGNVPNDLEAFEKCDFALDKLRIIELPCRRSDTVYTIDRKEGGNSGRYFVKEFQLAGAILSKDGKIAVVIDNSFYSHQYFLDNIFFNKEEAKKEVEKLNSDKLRFQKESE